MSPCAEKVDQDKAKAPVKTGLFLAEPHPSSSIPQHALQGKCREDLVAKLKSVARSE